MRLWFKLWIHWNLFFSALCPFHVQGVRDTKYKFPCKQVCLCLWTQRERMQGFGMDAEGLVPCKQVASVGGKKQGIQFEQLVCTHKMLCTAIFSNAEHCNGRAGSLFCRGSSMSRVPLANSRSASQAHCGRILFKTPPSTLLQKVPEMEGRGFNWCIPWIEKTKACYVSCMLIFP